MKRLKSAYTLTLITALVGACSDDGKGGTEASGNSTATTETSSDGSTTGGPTTAEPTSTGTTHDHGTTHDDETGETTHDHGTETTHDHETTDHATDTAGSTEPASTTDEPASVADFCACMLVNCHDLYHGTWGEDHHEAEEMCAAAAGAFSAEVLTCRLAQCEAAAGDEALCEGTLQGPPCE